jgi:U1 small nuclear ribonucleoprotein
LSKGNGRRVDGRRVIVDYERGRTKKEWLPRRLGGGKGDTRRDREEERFI